MPGTPSNFSRYAIWLALLGLFAWGAWERGGPAPAAAVEEDAGSAAEADSPESPGDANLVLAGRVTRVTDGDTAVVELDSGSITVRFHGVDAPEMAQPFGREAKRFMADLIDGEDVELVPIEHDRYDRLVAVVLVGGESANEALIASGYGWAYRNYLGQLAEDADYCRLEADARSARRGLWSQPTERWVPPWIYRERARSPAGTAVPARDYANETAADCEAAMRRSREDPRAADAPAATPAPVALLGASSGDCLIKGNINGKGERIYHLPGGENYERTRINTANGERWFCSEAEARAAGWRAAR